LLTIAEITNKYHFIELGGWVVKTLKAVFDQTTVSPLYHERILHMAMMSSDTVLCASFVSTLIARLMDGSLPPTETLIIADRLQIRDLQGVAYYAQLMALQKNNSDTIAFPAGCPLSKDQRVRLLAGHWSLARRWEHLRDTPIAIEQSQSCPTQLHNMKCRPYWDNQWRTQARTQSVTQHTSADVLGKVQAMQNLLQLCVLRQNASVGPTNPPQQNIPSLNNHPQPIMPGVGIPPQNPHAQFFQQLLANNQQHIHGNPAIHMMRGMDFYPPCVQGALSATKNILDDIRTSLLDFFSEDALGMTQGSS
jgi:hypothetical protein